MSLNPLARLRPLRCPSCDARPSHGLSSEIQIRRCSLKPPLRTKSVGTKVSEAEFAVLEERARGAGMRLAEWVREALLAAPVEPVAGRAWTPARSRWPKSWPCGRCCLNLHFRAAKGEPVAESEMRGLIERADGSKMQRARERMEAVRTAARATDPEPEAAAETNPEEG